MRLLASGIDTLNLSVRGAIRESVWELLAEMQRRARKKEPSELVSFAVTEQAFECRPYGRRGYTYWLSSPDYELILGRSTKFPEALVELHSPFLHSMGIGAALDQVERLFRLDLFAGPFTEGVSRIDLHADMQGWHLRTADLDRFVGYGRHRRAFEDNRQVFQSGSRLSGFMFGRDALVARIYDKTAQIRKDGISWLPDLWGENFDPGAPVWRVEFQFRREAIADFQTRTVDEVRGDRVGAGRMAFCSSGEMARASPCCRGPAASPVAARPRLGGSPGGAHRADHDGAGAPARRPGVGVEVALGDPGLRGPHWRQFESGP